jgi:hypothetical protein
MFWEEVVTVILRKKCSYESVFNFEWLQRQSCWNVAFENEFYLWGWMKSEVHKMR